MNSPITPNDMTLVYTAPRVADFPITDKYANFEERESSPYQTHDGILDDVNIYHDQDTGKYYYQVVYTPDAGANLLGTAEPLEGKLVEITDLTQEQMRRGKPARNVLSVTIDDVRLPVMASDSGDYMGDKVNDELKIRLKDRTHIKEGYDTLSIYGNVDRIDGAGDDYSILSRMQSEIASYGTMAGDLDINGDGKFEEGIEKGDKPNQKSIIFARENL